MEAGKRPEMAVGWQGTEVLVVVALWLAGLRLLGFLLHGRPGQVALLRLGGFFLSYGLPVLWLRYRRIPWRQLGLRAGRWGVAREVGLGLLTGALLALAVWLVKGGGLVVEPQWLLGVPLLLLTVEGAGAGLLAPLGEEVFFRGFLYGYLRRMGVAPALVLQAVIFAAAHHRAVLAADWPAVVLHFGQGFFFGLLYEASGGLAAPVAAHGSFNLLAPLLVAGR